MGKNLILTLATTTFTKLEKIGKIVILCSF